MKSSYKNNINYKDIFSTICFLKKPSKIVEFGILDGYSLKSFVNNIDSSCNIQAYDIFEEFNGNSAKKDKLIDIFKSYENVNIDYGDYFKMHNILEKESIDILHIDIANNGDVYNFAFTNYIDKIKNNGIIILEGGSYERDNVEWMIKYNKSKIRPILNNFSSKYNILTIGDIPSLTIISKK